MQAFSFSTFKICLFSEATNKFMGYGTGFFAEYKGKQFLVSNYHIFSGLNPITMQPIHNSGAIPGRFEIDFYYYAYLEKGNTNSPAKYKSSKIDIELYVGGAPIWVEHPELRNHCDLAVIPVGDVFKRALAKDFTIFPIDLNRAEEYQAEVNVMDEVYIIGYPLNSETCLTEFPIYKSGRIASEPSDYFNGKRYYLDSKTKPGMSGSPVIQKEPGNFFKEGNKYKFTKGRINFLGIYSGRAEIRKNEYEAELGIVWPYEEYLLPILKKLS